MIEDDENHKKFIILNLVQTVDENKNVYICSKCSHLSFSSLLTNFVAAEDFRPCLHSQLCCLIWGDNNLVRGNEDENNLDLVEVITEKPRYLAVVHPAKSLSKDPGIVMLSTKTLRPKCIVCRGNDCCVHLRIHSEQYKRKRENESESDSEDSDTIMSLRVDKLPHRKRVRVENDYLDPFQFEGPASNVFNISIDLFQTDEAIKRNRQILVDKNPFDKDILIAKYDPEELCPHGNRFDSRNSILCMESTKIFIHHNHTRDVDTSKMKLLYRPVLHQPEKENCVCRKQSHRCKNILCSQRPVKGSLDA